MRMWECLVKFTKDAAYVLADSILWGGGAQGGWESRRIGGVKGKGGERGKGARW